jgi:hypothetical protein
MGYWLRGQVEDLIVCTVGDVPARPGAHSSHERGDLAPGRGVEP